MRAQHRSILVLLQDKQIVPVDAIVVGEHYAFHPLVTASPSPARYGWVITHLGSGTVVWTVKEWFQAVEVACLLAEESPLPPDATNEILQEWMRENPEIVQTLLQRLTEKGPRWVPPAFP